MTTAREFTLHRVWHPPQSAIRVEYSDEFLRQVQREGEGERRGILYGRRGDGEVRLLAARRLGYQRDLRLIGLEHVGMFAVRRQGQVFLTEHDLDLADRLSVNLILVAAGDRGGFFIRNSDRSIQGIRSFQEFPLPAYEGTRKPSPLKAWVSGAIACGSLIVCVALYASPKVPLTLSAREQAGQLIVQWNRGVNGTLEIANNLRTLQVPISPLQKETVFIPDRGQVTIRLVPLDEPGVEQALRVDGRETPDTPPVIEEIHKLRQEHEQLQAEAEANANALARLEKIVPQPVVRRVHQRAAPPAEEELLFFT